MVIVFLFLYVDWSSRSAHTINRTSAFAIELIRKFNELY